MTHEKTHPIVWVALTFMILTFIFFIASVFVLEFAVTVDSDGDIIIPWYYWFFFAGAGVFLVIFVILQSIPAHYADKNIKATQIVETKAEYVPTQNEYVVGQREYVIGKTKPTYGGSLMDLLRQ